MSIGIYTISQYAKGAAALKKSRTVQFITASQQRSSEVTPIMHSTNRSFAEDD